MTSRPPGGYPQQSHQFCDYCYGGGVVVMTWKPELNCYECPICRSAKFPPERKPASDENDSEYRTPAEMFADVSRPPGGLIKKGGKEGVGRKRKKPKKRWDRRLEQE